MELRGRRLTQPEFDHLRTLTRGLSEEAVQGRVDAISTGQLDHFTGALRRHMDNEGNSYADKHVIDFFMGDEKTADRLSRMTF